MADYLDYIGDWVGYGFITPLIYIFAIAGPFAIIALLVVWGDSKKDAFNVLKYSLYACTFFAYFFLCMGTGSYIGSKFGFGFIGILVGMVFFYYSAVGFGWILDRYGKEKRESHTSQ